DSFGHYRRVVWLAQSRDPALEAGAQAVADRFGLPLTVIDTGTARLERELELLLAASQAPAPSPGAGSPEDGSPGASSPEDGSPGASSPEDGCPEDGVV